MLRSDPIDFHFLRARGTLLRHGDLTELDTHKLCCERTDGGAHLGPASAIPALGGDSLPPGFHAEREQAVPALSPVVG